MRHIIWLIAYLTTLAIAPATRAEIVGDGERYWHDDAFIAYFDSVASAASVDTILANCGADTFDVLSDAAVLFRLDGSMEVDTAIDNCNNLALSDVTAAGYDYVVYIEDTVSESNVSTPLLLQPTCGTAEVADLWYLGRNAIDVCAAWEHTLGDTSVVIVILDSGIDLGHVDFTSDIGYLDDGQNNAIEVAQISPVRPWQTPGMDYSGHGTSLAGIVVAEHNGVGVAGISPGCKVIVADMGSCPRDATQPSECTEETYYTSDIIRGLAFVDLLAAENQDKRLIVICAWGFPFRSDAVEVRDMGKWFGRYSQRGNVLIVAASGHASPYGKDLTPPIAYAAYPALFSGERGPFYTEAVDNIVVAVGASTFYETGDPNMPYSIKAWDACAWASDDTCQRINDVSALGGGQFRYNSADVLLIKVATSTNRYAGGYSYEKGTSLAAAQVAGVAALVWSADPSLTPGELKYMLRMHGKDTAVSADGKSARRYGANWGANRSRGFWTFRCPAPGDMEELPTTWPEGGNKAATDIDFDSWCSPVFGSGTPDAGAMVTNPNARMVYRVYGGVAETDIELLDADIIRFHGDLVIGNGRTLTIGPSDPQRIVRGTVFGSDLTRSGVDTAKIEILFEDGGNAVINGGLLLGPYKYDSPENQSWYGVILEAGSQWGGTTPHDLQIIGATNGITVGSSDFAVDELRLLNCGNGLQVQAAVSVGSLAVVGAPTVAVQIGANGSLSSDGPTTLLGEGAGVFGIVALANSVIDLSGGFASITGFDYGLGLFGDVQVATGVTEITGCATGIHCASGVVSYSGVGLTVDGEDFGVGIALSSAALECTGATIVVQGVQKGVTCTGESTISGDITIDAPSVSGISVAYSTSTGIDGVTVLAPGQDGICVGPSAVVSASWVEIVGSHGTGVGVYSGSHATVRNSDLRFCSTALFADGSSTLDAGTFAGSSDPGNNVYYNSTAYDLINLNQNETVAADGNTWYYKGVAMCPPGANRVIGLYSSSCQ